jgi:hypothetical protein
MENFPVPGQAEFGELTGELAYRQMAKGCLLAPPLHRCAGSTPPIAPH